MIHTEVFSSKTQYILLLLLTIFGSAILMMLGLGMVLSFWGFSLKTIGMTLAIFFCGIAMSVIMTILVHKEKDRYEL